MDRHKDSVRHYGTFEFRGNPVVGYGLCSSGGGSATIFSFVDDDDAEAFFETCDLDAGIPVILNCAQVIFLCDYHRSLQAITPGTMAQQSYEQRPMLRLVTG